MTEALRCVYFGSSEFSAGVLRNLAEQKTVEIVLVVTQPDRPFGRKRDLKPSPVKIVALELGLEIYQPPSLKKLEPLYRLRELNYEFGIVVAYGQIIPQRILDTASRDYLNGHASDLPRWRGAAPMERAIMAQDESTAMCIMQMQSGLDTGDVLLREEIRIEPETDINTLEKLMFDSCNRLLPVALTDYERLLKERKPQPDEGVNYAEKLVEEDSFVNLTNWDATSTFARLQGLKKTYGIVFSYQGKKLRIFDADYVSGQLQCAGNGEPASPGEVVERTKKGFVVALKGGGLRIRELQLEGKKRMSVGSFLAGSHLKQGDRLDSYQDQKAGS